MKTVKRLTGNKLLVALMLYNCPFSETAYNSPFSPSPKLLTLGSALVNSIVSAAAPPGGSNHTLPDTSSPKI